MTVEQQAKAYLMASAMHRAERDVFDALTNAIGQRLEGMRTRKDVQALKVALLEAEERLWASVDAALVEAA
jgi:hypothetical protein